MANDLKAEAREGSRRSGRRQRAERALERQLVYQERKSRRMRGREDEVIPSMKLASLRVRNLLEQFQKIDPDEPVVEVGSGAHGLIFFFGAKHSVGVDPLAVSYSRLFPGWQGRVPIVAAFGEALPFADHTTHLTSLGAKRLLANLPLRVLSESSNIVAAKAQARRSPTRHVGDRLKRLFFKNALYEVIARRET